MGRQIIVKEKIEKPAVRAKINKCQALIDTLTECKDSASNYKTAADTAVTACKGIVDAESENLSGVYYEEKYIPYKDGFFTDIEALDDGCDSMFGEIADRITTLESMIATLTEDLYEEVEVIHWIYDD